MFVIMFLFLFVAYVKIEDKTNSIFSHSPIKPTITSSGSLGLWRYDQGKCVATYPNQTLIGEETFDWCSNIASKNDDNPWITYSFPNKAMRLTGYAIRNGCCYYFRCCNPETNTDIDGYCCCRLYSYSLQGSVDNHTWKTIHKVEKDKEYWYCLLKYFDFPETEPFKYIRLIMDEEYPGCQKCLQINQLELYGRLIDSFDTFGDYDINDVESDESVSIIGKIKRE